MSYRALGLLALLFLAFVLWRIWHPVDLGRDE
jgi:hypothetical protein